VPNGQIANVNIETLSARDKYWFHHFLGLRYETTSAQLRSIIDAARAYLERHPSVDTGDTIRVRFFRLGPFSLDVEIFAYIVASDWEPFLETQQELLLGIMEIVERAGAAIALPSQTLHLADSGADAPAASRIASVEAGLLGAPRQSAGSI
jgi:MscS family membrane protein